MLNIPNQKQIQPNLITAGMPDREALLSLRQEGFEAVISLALPNSQPAPEPDESVIVTSQGLSFMQIPVLFDQPTLDDFRLFRTLLDQLQGKKVLVHCALNYRVSSFVYLYRVLSGLATEPEARADLEAIWQPDEVWSDFIEEVLDSEHE